MKVLFANIVILLFLFPTLTQASEVDVTNIVIKDTNLDEQVSSACRKHCQGNRRHGRLTRVTIERMGGNQHKVRAFAKLKNHHHVNTLIGGGFAAYEYTMNVSSVGILNSQTCILKIIDISITNDQLGLNNLIKNEEGKTHKIANCTSFVR